MTGKSDNLAVLTCALCFFCAALPVVAEAGDIKVDEAAGQEQAEALEAGKIDKDDKKPSFVVLPIPLSSPSLGTGLVLAGVVYYQPEGSVRPWMTGGGVLWTDNGSRGGGLFQKAYLGSDRYRVTLAAGQADLNLRFYGIGSDAADRDSFIGITQRPTLYIGSMLRKVADSQYVGLRLRQITVDTEVPIGIPAYPDLEIPPLELDTRLIGPALMYEYDSRDSETAPSRGVHAEATAQWNFDSWGSDRDYAKVTASINHYRPLGAHGVLALRASVCDVGSDVPFFDLCLFGSSNDLRGYESGQYRDRTLLATQAEYRWQFKPRWGAVFFAGVGGVAPGFSDYRVSDLLPAAGVGLRFKASTQFNVNVSVDYAVGKDSDALYFSIGEAF